jgi:broad specificity phosphatase PhoE
MKWPSYIVIIRHAQSAYNALRKKKQADPVYREFRRFFDEGVDPAHLLERAKNIKEMFALGYSDYDTPLTREGGSQALRVGSRINSFAPAPDVVFFSPYARTRETLNTMIEGGFRVSNARCVAEDRIREQEHGLSLLYSDWRVFQTFHPEQRELYDLLGPYWYQYPQGESVSMVRDRIRLFTNMLVREYSGKVVYLVSHHLTKLSIRANYERLTPEQFIDLDRMEKPINCGITIYKGVPEEGVDGRLKLIEYNKSLY